MNLSTQERIESLLMTIDQLGMAKIKHLQKKHDLKGYRNACRVIKQLHPFVYETFHEKEKILYLNKEGRRLIGSTKEVKKNNLIEHTLLCNEVYFYFDCPFDWQTEYRIEVKEPAAALGIQFKGLTLTNSKQVISDAAFSRNGYLHLIEVDNIRDMADNKKKIAAYADLFKGWQEKLIPALYFFTSPARQQKLKSWIVAAKIRGDVYTFQHIKDTEKDLLKM